jgi:TolB-like protein
MLRWLLAAACLSFASLMGLWFWHRHLPIDPPIRSLAVLPLENLSGDSGQEYFTEGLTDELTTDLAKISALKVISRTSAMQFKRTKEPLQEVAKELNVDAVIEGAVERSGNRVRITARLIDARSDRNLWAETYERDMQDILALQNEVAGAIANEIRVELKPQEQARLATFHSINPDAEASYLIGQYEMNKWTREGIKKSFGYFQSAVQEDPSFAEAWAGLSDAYLQWGLIGIAPKAEALPKAMAAARKALELDDTLSEAHVSLASCTLTLEGSRPAVGEEMQRAIALDPSNARARQVYGRYLLAFGLFEQAIAQLKRAEELDPLTPKKKNNLGVALYFAGHYDEALQWFHQVPDSDLDSERRHRRMAEIYGHKGMQKEAIAELVTSLKLGAKPELAAQVERSYLSSGYVEAQKALLLGEVSWAEREAKAGTIPENAYWIARDYAELGKANHAIAWLATAYENNSAGFLDYKLDPQMAYFCSDSHAKELPPRLVPLCRSGSSAMAF